MSELETYKLLFPSTVVAHSSVVVKAPCYKPEDRGFETGSGELIFSIYLILPATIGSAVHSASNKNEYQKKKCFWGVKCGRRVGLKPLLFTYPNPHTSIISNH
jgi:hypothetical protein